jgi:outer membrane protein OmpA-like peptidoglycan-associated protein
MVCTHFTGGKKTMTRSLFFAAAALFTVACAGPAGMMGPPGPTGMTGSQGSTGMTGSQGSVGMTGSQGSTGMTGSQGSTGMTGSQGSAGVTGAQGPAGTTGARNPAYPGTGWTSLRDFTFDYDRTDIRSSELNQPSEIAAYARQNPSVRFGIDGSTDLLRGANQYNSGLSQRRMFTVRDALVQAGVSPDRIETGTFAMQRANCNDSIERCSQRDGRVEVLVRSNN